MSSKGRKGSRTDRDGGRDARRDVRDRGGSRRDRDTNRDRDRGDTRSWKSSSGESKSKPRDGSGSLPPFPKQRGYLKGTSFPRREQSSSRFEGKKTVSMSSPVKRNSVQGGNHMGQWVRDKSVPVTNTSSGGRSPSLTRKPKKNSLLSQLNLKEKAADLKAKKAKEALEKSRRNAHSPQPMSDDDDPATPDMTPRELEDGEIGDSLKPPAGARRKDHSSPSSKRSRSAEEDDAKSEGSKKRKVDSSPEDDLPSKDRRSRRDASHSHSQSRSPSPPMRPAPSSLKRRRSDDVSPSRSPPPPLAKKPAVALKEPDVTQATLRMFSGFGEQSDADIKRAISGLETIRSQKERDNAENRRPSDDEDGSDDNVSEEKRKKQKTIKEANALIEYYEKVLAQRSSADDHAHDASPPPPEFRDSPNEASDSNVSKGLSVVQAADGKVVPGQACRTINHHYKHLNEINSGTYGVVFRGRCLQTGEIYALKKVKYDASHGGGFPKSAIREVTLLLALKHENIVDVKEVVIDDEGGMSVFMVMEFMEHDLKDLMRVKKNPFSTSEIKCLMEQLLRAMIYMHDNWVIHRDIKTSNLLLNNKGILKVCDFGMARRYGDPLGVFSHMVVTQWYRCPELLLGCEKYSTAVDMWSVGCILGELLLNKPIFMVETDKEWKQLDKIFQVMGTPKQEEYPSLYELQHAKHFKLGAKILPGKIRAMLPTTSYTGGPLLSETGMDLLLKLLHLDPDKRISATDALAHPWFSEAPRAIPTAMMPTFPTLNKQKRHTAIKKMQRKQRQAKRTQAFYVK